MFLYFKRLKYLLLKEYDEFKTNSYLDNCNTFYKFAILNFKLIY